MAKTKAELDEMIAKKEQQIEKLRKQVAQKKHAQKVIERKERTHRLIQIGAIVEEHCGEIINLDNFSKYINQWAYKIKESQTANPEKFI